MPCNGGVFKLPYYFSLMDLGESEIHWNIKIIQGPEKRPASHSCEYCGKMFTFPSALREHRYTHTKEKPHTCGECGAGFGSYAGLWKHRFVHKKERPFSCTVCGRTFKSPSQLKYHMELHTGTEELSCSECPYKTKSRRCLKLHINTHRFKLQHVCLSCNKRFNSKSFLEEHMNRHSGKKPYRCTSCGKAYFAQSSLTVHEKNKHQAATPETCVFCGKQVIGGKRALQRHMQTHSTADKSVPCLQCHLMFSSDADLAIHGRLHSGDRPFKCNSCGEAFISKNFLRAHKRAVRHGPLQCDNCRRVFKKQSKLMNHLLSCVQEAETLIGSQPLTH